MQFEELINVDGPGAILVKYDIAASNAHSIYDIVKAIKSNATPETVNKLIDVAKAKSNKEIAHVTASYRRINDGRLGNAESVDILTGFIHKNVETLDIVEHLSQDYNERQKETSNTSLTSNTNLINQISSGVLQKAAGAALSKIGSGSYAVGEGGGGVVDLDATPESIISGKDIILESTNFGKDNIDTTSSVSLINKSASTTATQRSLKIVRKLAGAPEGNLVEQGYERIPTPLKDGRLYEPEPKTIIQTVVGAARNARNSIFGKPTIPELPDGDSRSLFDQGYVREEILDSDNPVSKDGLFRLVEGSGGDPGVRARDLALDYASTVERNKKNLRIANKIFDPENIPYYESAAALTPLTGFPLIAASVATFLGTAFVNYDALTYNSRIYRSDDFDPNAKFVGNKKISGKPMISRARERDQSIKGPTNRDGQRSNGNAEISVGRSYIDKASNIWRMQSPLPAGEGVNRMPERDRPIKVTPLTESQTGVKDKVEEDSMDSLFLTNSITQSRSNMNTNTSHRGASNKNAAGPNNGQTTGSNSTDDDGSLVGRFTKAVKNTADSIGVGGGIGGVVLLVGGSYILFKVIGRGTKRKRR